MGEFLLPDWDMFQSAGYAGEFHAMARTVSGGPVYLTDSPDAQRFDIIKKLATTEGKVYRCRTHARPCPDSLFADPRRDMEIMKIFNETPYAKIIGCFNCSYSEKGNIALTCSTSPSDAGAAEGRYFAWSSQKGELGAVSAFESVYVGMLDTYTADIITFSHIANGFALVGMTDKYNPSAFIGSFVLERNSNGLITVSVVPAESGECVFYLEGTEVSVNADYIEKNGLYTANCRDRLIVSFKPGPPAE